MISVRDTQKFAETSHFQCLYPSFNVCCYDLRFTCTQKYGHGQGTHQSDLGADGDVLVISARQSMSSAKRKFVIVLSPVLTVPSWSSSASAKIVSKKMLKRAGESRHHWCSPIVARNHSLMLLSWWTALVVL